MQFYKLILITLLVLAQIACSSNTPDTTVQLPDPDPAADDQDFEPTDSATIADDLPFDLFGPIDSVNTDTESIPGQNLVEQLEVSNSASRNGISIQIVNYGFVSAQTPRVTLRLDNTSTLPIHNAICSLKLLDGDLLIKQNLALLANFAVIEAGESAVYPVPFFDMENGFDDAKQLDISCEWDDGAGDQINVASDPVRFEILDFNLSAVGRPAVRVLATNNSGNRINRARCRIKAKVGNVIYDAASVLIGSLEPGEAQEVDGIFFFFDSLAGFELDRFDESTMDCSYI